MARHLCRLDGANFKGTLICNFCQQLEFNSHLPPPMKLAM